MRLPEEGMVRSTPEVRQRLREMRMWTNDTELLAQILEIGSVIASRHQIAKPREIPRPDWMKPSGSDGFQQAINVLRSTARRVRR
jgi:hypothetical protein